MYQQEAGDGSGVGGSMCNIQGLYEEDGIQGRGEVTHAVVATDGCRTTAEDYAKRDFGISMGVLVTRIWQAC